MVTPAGIKSLSRNGVARTFASWLGALYVRAANITTNWTSDGMAGPTALWETNTPFIGCFWHGRMIMMSSNWHPARPLYMLISGHPDGKLVARVVRLLGFKTLEGSTRRGGADALRAMLRILKDGGSIGITPDGPHGPRMRVSHGTIALAKLSGAPLLPTTFSSTKGKVFKSWDRFFLAGLFGKGVFLWGDPIYVPRDADAAEMERLRLVLEDSLNTLTRSADDRCGRIPVVPETDNPRTDATSGMAEETSP